EQVAAAALVQPLHALAVQRDDLAGLGARTDVDLLFAVERVDGDAGAQRSGGHRDLHGAVEVVATPLEDLVRQLGDLQEEVAGRTAARADVALTGGLGVRAVLDTRGDADLDRTAGADPAVTRALLARVTDDRAVAAALRARPGGHHLAQEGARDLGHLATAVAQVAGVGVRARRGARPLAHLAQHGGVHDDLARGAEGRLTQIKFDPDGGVPSPPGPRTRPSARPTGAEERVHDVAEREARTESAGSPGRRTGRGRVGAHVVHL